MKWREKREVVNGGEVGKRKVVMKSAMPAMKTERRNEVQCSCGCWLFCAVTEVPFFVVVDVTHTCSHRHTPVAFS